MPPIHIFFFSFNLDMLSFELTETKDGIHQTGTVNLHFLIPGTSEPITAMVRVMVFKYHLPVLYDFH